MKKIYFLIIALFIITQGYSSDWITINSNQPGAAKIELKSSTGSTEIVQFSIGGFWQSEITTRNGKALLISVEKGAANLKKGAPDLPVFTTSLVISANAKTDVKVISSQYKEYRNVVIAPSKGNLLRTIDPATVPYEFGKQYEINEFYPGEVVSLNAPYIIRDLRGQTVVFQPFQYNPITKTLRVFYDMTIEVYENGINNFNAVTNFDSESKPDSRFEEVYKRHFLNYSPADRYEPVEEQGNMLIISYGDFIDEIQPLADWRVKTGTAVEVVDVASIGNAAAIKTFIKNYYTLHGLTYVLLVGDAGQVPSSYINGYDSDVDYSFTAGNDHYPDLFVGRFSAETEEHVVTMVERTLNYETNPISDTSWYRKAIGIASSQGPGDDNEMDYQHIRNITNSKLIPFTYNYGYELFDGSQGGNDADGNPNPTQVATAINSGATIINYTGHGSQNSWGSSGFSSSNINSMLTNVGRLPFIISVACVNGDFVNGTCFAEAWMRKEHNGFPAGAIATLMSTINQSWNPPMCGQDEMNDILTEVYEDNIKRTFGGITMNGCMEMNDQYGSGGYEMTDTWTIFGDPSLMIRTDIPQEMTVSYEPSLTLGSNSFIVNSDAEGGLAALTMNGEIIGTAVVSGGIANITFDELDEPGTADVVLTAFNYKPFEGTVELIAASGAFVVYTNNLVYDSTGNLNGLADYAENITLTVGLANIGSDSAVNVLAGMFSSSPYITIISDVADYGIIHVGDTIYVSEGFELEIAENVPDGEELTIMLNAEEQLGRSAWESSFTLVAHAPELTFLDYEINDEQGNGDGKLDAGETANIIISIVNAGSASAYNLIAQLSTMSEYLTIFDEQFDAGDIAATDTIQLSFSVQADGDTPEAHFAEITLNLIADHNLGDEFSFYTIIGQKPVLIVNFTDKPELADSLFASLDELQTSAELMNVIPENLQIYRSVFIILGVYPDNYVLTTEEGSALATYLQNGGRVYMEGGDTWFYDEVTPVHTLFYILGLNDGSDDLTTVVGNNEGFMRDLVFEYDGDNNYLDQIDALPGANLLFSNQEPAYGVAVSFENEQYKTIGSSFEFGGLTDQPGSSKDVYMASILEFFGINYTWTGIEDNQLGNFAVTAYPNPFNEEVNITVEVPEKGMVTVEIFDLTGRMICTLASGEFTPGRHKFTWDSKSGKSIVKPGIYFYKVSNLSSTYSGKLILTN